MSDSVNINIEENSEKVNIAVTEELDNIVFNVEESSENITLVIEQVGATDPTINVRLTELENRTNISSSEQITINEAQADYINA
jgi:hypothetical protein